VSWAVGNTTFATQPAALLIRGYTLIEMLVVIAIISTVVTEIMAAVQIVREKERKDEVSLEMESLAAAESTFLISHGNYGTLAELIADGLAPGDLSDGKKHGYQFVIDIDPPPLPEFRIQADPYVPPLSVGFFGDESNVVRYALDASANVGSTIFVDVDSIPTSQAEIALALQIEDDARAFVRELDALPGTGSAIQSAIDLFASKPLAEAIYSGLDEDTDGMVSLQDFLNGDTLALARSIKGELGLADGGTSIASDEALDSMLGDYKMLLDSTVDPSQELVAPSVSYGAGLPGDPIAFLLTALTQSVPGLGPAGAILLVAVLAAWREDVVDRLGCHRRALASPAAHSHPVERQSAPTRKGTIVLPLKPIWLTAATLVRDDLCRFRATRVEIDDKAAPHERPGEANVEVAIDVDAAATREHLMDVWC
jgi:prepilin-type N-terminal cleavage/methylation domain-containing protein